MATVLQRQGEGSADGNVYTRHLARSQRRTAIVQTYLVPYRTVDHQQRRTGGCRHQQPAHLKRIHLRYRLTCRDYNRQMLGFGSCHDAVHCDFLHCNEAVAGRQRAHDFIVR